MRDLKYRLRVYKRLLKALIEKDDDAARTGFCYWLLWNTNEKKIECFPEIMAQKPKKMYAKNIKFWWSPYSDSQLARIKAVKRAIKLTLSKIRGYTPNV